MEEEEESEEKERVGSVSAKHVQKEEQSKRRFPIASMLGATSHEAAFRGKKGRWSHRPMIDRQTPGPWEEKGPKTVGRPLLVRDADGLQSREEVSWQSVSFRQQKRVSACLAYVHRFIASNSLCIIPSLQQLGSSTFCSSTFCSLALW
jgi:hypothetical protein